MQLLNRLNPTIKCLTIIICGLILAFTYSIALNLGVLIVCLILLLCSSFSFLRLLNIIFWVSVAAGGLFMAGWVFPANSEQIIDGSFGHSIVFPASIYSGLQLATRLFAFALLGMSFALTTNMTTFIQSLEQQLQLPAKFAYGILAALHLAPMLPFEYKKNVRALQARGLHTLPLSPRLLTPLMIKTIRWSESLAIAMESKGFDENKQRTHYQIVKVKWFDYLFMVVMIGGLSLGVFFL